MIAPTSAATHCVYCHRLLHNPVSVEAGAGPVCRARHALDDEYERTSFLSAFDPATMDIICHRQPDGTPIFNVAQAHAHHSPTGFEWGYGGSGPADFALNILALFLPVVDRGPEPEDDEAWAVWCAAAPVRIWDGSSVSERAWDLHQDFKWTFIAGLPREGGVIPGATIRAWIAERTDG